VAADEEYELAISQIQSQAGGSQPCLSQREGESKTVRSILELLRLLLDLDE